MLGTVRYLGTTKPTKIQNADLVYEWKVAENISEYGKVVGRLK